MFNSIGFLRGARQMEGRVVGQDIHTYCQDRLLLRNTGISFSIRLVPGVGVLGFSGTQDLWQKQCRSVELGGAQGEG